MTPSTRDIQATDDPTPPGRSRWSAATQKIRENRNRPGWPPSILQNIWCQNAPILQILSSSVHQLSYMDSRGDHTETQTSPVTCKTNRPPGLLEVKLRGLEPLTPTLPATLSKTVRLDVVAQREVGSRTATRVASASAGAAIDSLAVRARPDRASRQADIGCHHTVKRIRILCVAAARIRQGQEAVRARGAAPPTGQPASTPVLASCTRPRRRTGAGVPSHGRTTGCPPDFPGRNVRLPDKHRRFSHTAGSWLTAPS